MSDYIIKYNVLLDNTILTDKIVKVKNKANSAIAQVELEKYLQRKYGNRFRQLQVLTVAADNLNELFKHFGIFS